MNPEKPSREEIEAKLTALLLGELPAEEAQLLRWAVSQDAALAQLHDRLKATIGFVSEVAANPAETIPTQTAPLKLSEERREKLLAHFKTVAPKEFAPLVPPLKKRREISPLLAMAAAIVLIAVLAAMLLPSLAKSKSRAMWASVTQSDKVAARIAADSAQLTGDTIVIDQNSPAAATPMATPQPAAPQVALDQRAVGLEEYVSNGDPTANGGDSFQKQNQTTIVLPAGGTDDKELATASPVPTANFNFGLANNNLDRDVRLNNADPSQVAPALQNMFGSSAVQTPAQIDLALSDNRQAVAAAESENRRIGGAGGGGASANVGEHMQTQLQTSQQAEPNAGDAGIFTGTTRDDVSGLRYLYSAHNIIDESQSSKKAAAETDAAKVPMLGDIPALGNAFHKNSPVGNLDIDGEGTLATAPAATVTISGNILGVDALAKSGTGALALNGVNSFSGGTTVSAGNLGMIKDENGNLAYNNNGTVGTAQITVDPDTHNLVIIADKETEDQIQSTLNVLDRAPAAPPVAQNQAVVLSRPMPLPVAAMPPPPAVAERELRLALNNEVKTGNIPVKQGNETTDAPQLYTRTFKIDPNKFYQGLQSVTTFSFGPANTNSNSGGGLHLVTAPDTTEGVSTAARNFFGSLGVDLTNSGKSVFFNDRLGQLFVRGTEQDLDTVQQAVQMIASSPAAASVATDVPLPKSPSPAPIPTPEILTRENAFSTFSLNVSDVSFKLAAASLERGQLPDAASIRSEEFLNAFDYHDPEPAAGVPVAFVAERARDPFAHNRDLLRFSIKTAAAGREPGRPLNLVLLLDNSGSMERADRVAIIHEALKVLASQLQPQDTLSIVTFARTARLWVDGARGDQAGTAVNKVSDLVPEGGTNLEEAMNLAYATARRHYLANGGNRVVLLTDGAANLGNVDPEALKQKVESFRKQGIALDCFGIGWEGYNDDLLEVLSSNGDGRYGFINTPEAATTEFAAQLAGALHVAAEDVKVQVEFNPQRVISYRQIGYAKHQLTKEQFRDNTVAAAPLAAREAGNALYTVEINPQGEGPVATVRVRFRIPGTTDVSEHEWQVPFDGTAPALEKSSPSMRLAATASAFSEWLASSSYAQEVTTDQLLNYLNGVPAIYGADARPKQLETMIREAKSISGK